MIARIHSLMPSSTVNGPGTRAVLWFQGCSLHCSSCWNPETHSVNAGTKRATQHLLSWVTAIRTPIEGVTFSGGEPMQQPAALLDLVQLLAHHAPRLSLGMFSGFSERELEAIPEWPAIRYHLDWAVLGRYNKLQPSEEPLVTSANQRLRLYSARYTPADFENQSVEVVIASNGLTQITGFPVRGF